MEIETELSRNMKCAVCKQTMRLKVKKLEGQKR